MAFRVPCRCGRAVAATVGDAGATLNCPCGLPVAVPELRALRQLEPEPEPRTPAAASVGADQVRRRGMWFAAGGSFVLLLGGVSLLVMGENRTPGEATIRWFEAILLVSVAGFWLGTAVATVFQVRARGYPFSSELMRLALFGPIGYAVALLLSARDE
jgi:hypothetical protein